MQITKEIIDSSEIRLNLTISKLKTILLVCSIGFTSLLVRQTLQIQHSCNPMIHWFRELPAECKLAVKTDYNNFDNFSSQTQQELKTSEQLPQIAQQRDRTQLSISRNTVESQPEVATNSPKTIEPKTNQDISQSEPQEQSNSVGQFVNEHSNDIVGAVAGVAGGVATVAAASATAAFSIPVAGAVAIGMGIWFLIRSAL